MFKSIVRPCFYCKGDVILDNDNLIYDIKLKVKKYYHFDCYVNYHFNKKFNKLTKDEITEQALKLQEIGKNDVKDIIYKDRIYQYIVESYNIKSLPQWFFVKMDSIYNGEFKGLSVGIPPEHLLDMWQRKRKELDKINQYQKTKGKKKDLEYRLNYDISIIISKYDSYLEWLEQQKILERETLKRIEESQKQQIDFNKINKVVDSNKSNNNEEVNINDLLDEMF